VFSSRFGTARAVNRLQYAQARPILGLSFLTVSLPIILILLPPICWAQSNAVTYHYDNGRTGQNTNETVLTPSNVNSSQFGKLFSQSVDGQIYAQPLYVPNLTIPGLGTHNVVFVNTENDSVFAFDADNNKGANSVPLWQVSLIDHAHGAAPGSTPVPSSAYPVDSDHLPDCGAISPELGSTSTPVIDTTSGIMYVEAFSFENGVYVHRLHALDITSGAEEAFGPVVIAGSVAGTGDGTTTVTFNPFEQHNRAGLLLSNGSIYVAYASSCPDQIPFHGWVFAYDAITLTQQGIFASTPNGTFGGIWMSGGGLAADQSGNVYTSTGNGDFDTINVPATDVGDSVLKLTLNSGVLGLRDYFTPYDQDILKVEDKDLASGGLLLLPDQPGSYPHELVAAGKEGRIYLINRDQFTTNNQHYCANCSSDPQIVQESASGEVNGVFSSPTYWNKTIYYWTPALYLIAIPLSNGLLNYGNISISQDSYGWPGANMSVSANGNTNGILWALKTDAISTGGPVVLRAYDATNVSKRLYSSDQNPSDAAGPAVKFTVPTVINGKVYVGSANQLSVYGLSGINPSPTPTSSSTPSATPTPLPTVSPTSILSPTPSMSPSPTPTLSPTPSVSPSNSPSPTPSMSPSPSPSPSPTPIAGASISIVALPTSGNGCSENDGAGANTLNLGTPNPTVQAGDTMIVVVNGLNPGSAVTSITNRAGATGDVWQEAANVYGTDSVGGAVDIWFASNINAATNGANITINTTTGNTYIGACVFEVHGLTNINPQDGGAVSDITSNVSTLVSPSIQGRAQPELFVAVSACANTGKGTVAEGGILFTALDGGAGNGVGGCPGGYFISSANGTYQAGLTQSPAGSGVVAIASFMAAGATLAARPTPTP
jgi:hypothetical protein